MPPQRDQTGYRQSRDAHGDLTVYVVVFGEGCVYVQGRDAKDDDGGNQRSSTAVTREDAVDSSEPGHMPILPRHPVERAFPDGAGGVLSAGSRGIPPAHLGLKHRTPTTPQIAILFARTRPNSPVIVPTPNRETPASTGFQWDHEEDLLVASALVLLSFAVRTIADGAGLQRL